MKTTTTLGKGPLIPKVGGGETEKVSKEGRRKGALRGVHPRGGEGEVVFIWEKGTFSKGGRGGASTRCPRLTPRSKTVVFLGVLML